MKRYAAVLFALGLTLPAQGPAPIPLEPFCLVIPESGTYQFWHRVIAPNSNADSFFVKIDGLAEFIDDACEKKWPCDGTFWTPLTHRTPHGDPTTVPYKLVLRKGTKVVVTLRVREAGIQLVELAMGVHPPP